MDGINSNSEAGSSSMFVVNSEVGGE